MISISFNNKKYSIDSCWVNISDKDKERGKWIKEARAKCLSTFQDFPLCILRVGRKYKNPFQYGITSFEEGKSKKHAPKLKKLPKPLILFLVDVLPRNFLGIFPLAGGYWVCAMNNGQILFDGDKFFQEKELAQEHFEELKSKIVWDVSWKGQNGDSIVECASESESEEWISRVLSADNYAGRGDFIDLSKKPSGSKAVTWTLLLLILAIGGYMYMEMFGKEEGGTPPRPVSQLFPKVWESSPSALDLLKSCEKNFEEVPFVENMWMFGSGQCTPEQGMKLTYKRSNIGSYLSAPEGAMVDLMNPNVSTKTLKHGKKLLPRNHEILVSERDAVLRFREFFRVLGGAATKQVLAVQKPLVKTDGEPPVQVKAPYGLITFSVVTKEFPEECAMFFSGLPGAVVEEIVFTVNNGIIEWTFSGKIYTLARK